MAVRKPSRGQSVTRPRAPRAARRRWSEPGFEPATFRAYPLKQSVHLSRLASLQWHKQPRVHRLSQGLHELARLLIEVGHRDFGAGAMHGLCATPGDRLVVCDSNDQGLLPGEHRGSFSCAWACKRLQVCVMSDMKLISSK